MLALDDLKLLIGHEIRPAVASAEDVTGLIGRMSRLEEAVAQAIEDEGGVDETVGGPVTEIRESAEDAPIIKHR